MAMMPVVQLVVLMVSWLPSQGAASAVKKTSTAIIVSSRACAFVHVCVWVCVWVCVGVWVCGCVCVWCGR